MSTSAPYTVYRDHLRAGRLAFQVSPSTGRAVFFPRVLSPFDVAETLEWQVSRGVGTVYSTTIVYRKDEPPRHVALVDVDEGFRLMTRVEGCPPEQVTIGLRVRFTTRTEADDGSGDPYPVFEPVTGP